jgi:hypothetical protein
MTNISISAPPARSALGRCTARARLNVGRAPGRAVIVAGLRPRPRRMPRAGAVRTLEWRSRTRAGGRGTCDLKAGPRVATVDVARIGHAVGAVQHARQRAGCDDRCRQNRSHSGNRSHHRSASSLCAPSLGPSSRKRGCLRSDLCHTRRPGAGQSVPHAPVSRGSAQRRLICHQYDRGRSTPVCPFRLSVIGGTARRGWLRQAWEHELASRTA